MWREIENQDNMNMFNSKDDSLTFLSNNKIINNVS